MDWIKQVRSLLSDFTCEYVKDEFKKYNKMLELIIQVEFFMRRGQESYDGLINHMKKCCINKYSERDYDLLILHSQYVLNRTWRRLVTEGRGKPFLSEKK